MKSKDKGMPVKSSVSTTLYIASAVAALIGIASLVNNILLFKNTVANYVAQGYPANFVTSQLLPSQLLPAIFESVALYGGIAFLLFGVGAANKKVLSYLIKQDNYNTLNEVVLESTIDETPLNVENADASEEIEVSEKVKND